MKKGEKFDQKVVTKTIEVWDEIVNSRIKPQMKVTKK